MGYIQGANRNQIILFPESIDEYIEDNNLVRFIDVFVDSLDLLKLGFEKARPAYLGRNPYDPADLLKLYIYGYLYKIRSSRKLEQETHKNVELMWLIRKLKPDFKTIADFRKNNKKVMKKVFKKFIVICKKLDLFGKELIAIDGSKFKAVNSKDRSFTLKQIQKELKKIEESIEKYVETLDKVDKEESKIETITVDDLNEKIKYLEKKKENYKKLEQEVKLSGKDQISLTDPDSRIMKTKNGTDICFNVQTIVDDKHRLMVDFEVTNECSDINQLTNMCLKAKEVLEVEKIEATLDTGYYNSEQVKECGENGVTVYIPEPKKNNGIIKDEEFYKSNFKYNKENDTYTCPNKIELTYAGDKKKEKGKVYRLYKTEECLNCQFKEKCMTNKNGRTIYRWEHEQVLDDLRTRVQTNKEKVKKRKTIVEHHFGTIKRWFDQGYFLMKGLQKVEAEFSLTALAFNIKRVLNIVGFERLMEAIG